MSDKRFERVERRLDEIDTEVVAVQDVAFNGFWPALAVAFALIDKGVVDRKDILNISDLLHDHVAAHAEPGRGEDALHSLEQFREFLADPAWTAGRVLPELQKVQSADGLAALLRLQAESRKKRRPPEQG